MVAASPVSVNEVAGGLPAVPVTEPTVTPLRRMSYRVTATLSVDAVQVRVMSVPLAVPARLVGVVGRWVSDWQNGGVTESVALACETLPAASRALTYHPQVTPCATVSVAVRVLPATEVTSWPSW